MLKILVYKKKPFARMFLKLKLMNSQQFRMTDDEMREMLDLSEVPGVKCVNKIRGCCVMNCDSSPHFARRRRQFCNSWRKVRNSESTT